MNNSHSIELKKIKIIVENIKKEKNNMKMKFISRIRDLKKKSENNKEEVFKKLKEYIHNELGKWF